MEELGQDDEVEEEEKEESSGDDEGSQGDSEEEEEEALTPPQPAGACEPRVKRQRQAEQGKGQKLQQAGGATSVPSHAGPGRQGSQAGLAAATQLLPLRQHIQHMQALPAQQPMLGPQLPLLQRLQGGGHHENQRLRMHAAQPIQHVPLEQPQPPPPQHQHQPQQHTVPQPHPLSQPQQQEFFGLVLEAAATAPAAASGLTAELAASFFALLHTLAGDQQAVRVRGGSLAYGCCIC